MNVCDTAGPSAVEHCGTQHMIQVLAKEALKLIFTFKGAVYILLTSTALKHT